MSGCPAITANGNAGIADALRAVDCMSGQATSVAFSRLFGSDAMLGTVLTLLLTLYIGFLAINLLTGRSKLGLSMLTPRAFALGMALTFATSWVAYQNVVWNLAVGAPDQIASIMIGTHGSATSVFASRLDGLFSAVADAAAHAQAGTADTTPKAAGFTPADMLWLGALLLLLGTVGVLIVTKIALAALLAVGPLFVVLSLFRDTRGLFEGWLKGVALFALTPLFAVLIGAGAIASLTPVVSSLGSGDIDMRAAVTVLLAAAVYCALMAIVVKVSVTLTSGWRLPSLRDAGGAGGYAGLPSAAPGQAAAVFGGAPPASLLIGSSDRVRAIVASASAPSLVGPTAGGSADRVRSVASTTIIEAAPAAGLPGSDNRLRGIGSQFRLPTSSREKMPC